MSILHGVMHWFQSHWDGLQENLVAEFFITLVLSIPLFRTLKRQSDQLQKIKERDEVVNKLLVDAYSMLLSNLVSSVKRRSR